MAVTVTNTTISAINTVQAMTANAATATGVGVAEVFTFTPTKSSGKIAIILTESTTGATGKCSYSIAAGDLGFASKALTGSFGDTAAAGSVNVLEFDSAHVMQDDGTIAITISPTDTSADYLTLHSLKMYALELL